jgi:hypothetical protein
MASRAHARRIHFWTLWLRFKPMKRGLWDII